MAQKIKIAFIGEGALLSTAIGAVLDKGIVPKENVLVARTDEECAAFEGRGVTFLPDEMNAVVKAEFVVVCADKKRELGTALAPVMGCMRGRIVIAVCPGIDVAYVAERVVKGTDILAAPVTLAEDGTYHAVMELSAGFLSYQLGPCRDILASFCILDDANA